MKVVSKTMHCFLFLAFLSERRLCYWCVAFKRIVWGQGETWTQKTVIQSVRSVEKKKKAGENVFQDDYLSLTLECNHTKRSYSLWCKSTCCAAHTAYVMFAHRWKKQRKPWRRDAPVWTRRSTPSPVSWQTWRAARPTSPGAHKYDTKHSSTPEKIHSGSQRGKQLSTFSRVSC